VIYDGLKAAVAAGVPKDRAGILVDEQFGAAILRDAARSGYITCAPAEKGGQEEFDFEYGEDFAKHVVLAKVQRATDGAIPSLIPAPQLDTP
jgi:myo-inositol catabolism protein IolC